LRRYSVQIRIVGGATALVLGGRLLMVLARRRFLS
jgi:hypothetical protein